MIPRMIFQTGIAKLGSFENTPIVVERHDVRHHPLQHRDRLRPEHPQAALALRAQARHHHLLLRPEQPRRRPSMAPHVYMGTLDAHLVALDGKDRQGALGQRGGRPGLRVQHHPRPAHHRRQRDRRRVRRRVRHPGQRDRLQRGDRQAGLALVLDSRPEGRSDLRRQGPERLVGHLGPEGRRTPTCIATSPRKRPTARSTPMPGRPAAAACG